MKLYNTLTKKNEELKPLHGNTVSIYSCGPTVYDHVHIGNLRSFIFTDVLRRAIQAEGFELNAVMNITDVDDKTIHRSLKEYRSDTPEKGLKELTQKYEALYLEDCKAVGIDLSDTKLVRATEHIQDMTQLITELTKSEMAYVGDDGIYFDISAYQSKYTYGLLSRIEIADSQHRIDNDEYDKNDARDFALWKKADVGEPTWDISINGQTISGRPGWHIECSAMSVKYLGQPFDIHTGGVDLVFPHHENEIAQSKAVSGEDLATTFVHNEHLLVDGKKMSKSLNNFYTLNEIKTKGYDPLVFRLLILMSHYRSQQNFTWEALEAAQNTLANLYSWADLVHQGSSHEATWLSAFSSAIANDLSTPEALAILQSHLDEAPSTDTLKAIDEILGIGLSGRPDISTEQKAIIKAREQARDNKDFAVSDKLRSQLRDQKIEIEDTPTGPHWRRI